MRKTKRLLSVHPFDFELDSDYSAQSRRQSAQLSPVAINSPDAFQVLGLPFSLSSSCCSGCRVARWLWEAVVLVSVQSPAISSSISSPLPESEAGELTAVRAPCTSPSMIVVVHFNPGLSMTLRRTLHGYKGGKSPSVREENMGHKTALCQLAGGIQAGFGINGQIHSFFKQICMFFI